MDKNFANKIEAWIKDYVKTSNANGVVVGISGGKDSLVVAKLCANALGKDNVFGVIMPNGNMKDIDDAVETCKLLDIKYDIINIEMPYKDIIDNVKRVMNGNEISSVTKINTAPRLRMTTLYAVAGSLNYLVANTSNLSEAMIGYTTKWGDNVGDFAPIANLTKTEVCELGILLGLPDKFVNKAPSDGLSGQSDEEKIGFTYDELDKLIRNNKKGENYNKILNLNKMSQHKRIGAVKFDFENINFMEKNYDNKRR